MNVVAVLLPTPSASDGIGGGPNNPENRLAQGHQVQLLDLGIAKPETWERYKPAIERWERLTRDAPEPTEIGTQGKPRLNPRFSEWVMGWYEGWVTDFINPTRKKDPDKVSRSAVLKMIGNGVVPQQAVSALESLMVRFDNERVRDMNTQAIVSQLDAYTGDNIWEDVIYHLDGFDGAATDELNPTTTVWDDNRFVVDGVTYWQTDAGWFSVNAAEFDR